MALSSFDHVNQLLEQLARQLNVEPFGLDEEQHVCGFAIPTSAEDIIFTLFMPEPGTDLLCMAEITTLSADNPQDLRLLHTLLCISFPGITNRGCVLSIDERSQQLVLSFQHAIASLNLEALESILANLVELVSYFRGKVASLRQQQKAGEPAGSTARSKEPVSNLNLGLGRLNSLRFDGR